MTLPVSHLAGSMSKPRAKGSGLTFGYHAIGGISRRLLSEQSGCHADLGRQGQQRHARHCESLAMPGLPNADLPVRRLVIMIYLTFSVERSGECPGVCPRLK
jgi:hypothetical protein